MTSPKRTVATKPKIRPVQYFSDEYLERCRKLSPADIVRFLDDFRRLYGANCGPLDEGPGGNNASRSQDDVHR